METDFIRWLHSVPPHPNLILGAGDDAAILRLAQDANCVLSVDMLTEGVDFELAKTSAVRVGRKALAVNLSDLAAMAARPVAAVIAVALPRSGGLTLAKELYEGMLPLTQEFEMAIAGGDTNSWHGPLVISVTVVGETTAAGPLLRSGARAGDKIIVTGRFGGSILGHHFDFTPRVREALYLKENFEIHAGIDVSDGLSLDLARLAEECGCGAVIELDTIPISPAAVELARQLNDGSTALDHALSDGEDFELILAVPPQMADELIANHSMQCGLTCIGEFVTGRGLWQGDASRNRQPLQPRGYEHRLDP